MLTIPDIRQRAEHDCGEAAIKCVLAYYGLPISRRQLASPIDGTDPRQIESELRQRGLRVVSGEASLDDLQHWCKAGKPVICLVHWTGEADSHYIVVCGVYRGKVYYHDVSSGLGACYKDDFEACWKAGGRLGESYKMWSIVGWV